MGLRKAAGEDVNIVELFKFGGNHMDATIFQLAYLTFDMETIPDDWEKRTNSPHLQKQGNTNREHELQRNNPDVCNGEGPSNNITRKINEM